MELPHQTRKTTLAKQQNENTQESNNDDSGTNDNNLKNPDRQNNESQNIPNVAYLDKEILDFVTSFKSEQNIDKDAHPGSFVLSYLATRWYI